MLNYLRLPAKAPFGCCILSKVDPRASGLWLPLLGTFDLPALEPGNPEAVQL